MTRPLPPDVHAALDETLGIVCRVGYMAYRNSCVGNPAPAVKEFFDRSIAIEPGDIVLEISSIHASWHTGAAGKSLGRLLQITMEPCFETEDSPTEHVWHIESLIDKSVTRWRNADFIAILEAKF